MAQSFSVYASGWKTVKAWWVYVSGAWRPVKNAWVYQSGAWRQFYTAITLSLTQYSYSHVQSTSYGTGFIFPNTNTGVVIADIQIPVTVTGGTFPVNITASIKSGATHGSISQPSGGIDYETETLDISVNPTGTPGTIVVTLTATDANGATSSVDFTQTWT